MLRATYGLYIPPTERPQHDAFLADLRTRLGEGPFSAAFSGGESLSPQAAIEEALAIATERVAEPVQSTQTPSTPFNLTERELEVLTLMVDGLSDKDIADAPFISSRTVQKHATNIFTKLDVNTRTAAATTALRAGLIPEKTRPA